MKKRTLKLVIGMTAALCIGMMGTAVAAEAETETEAATETVTEASDSAALEIIILQAEEKDALEVKNTAELDIKAASVEAQEDSDLVTITLVAKDGQEYEFVNVQYDAILEPELVMEGAFAVIKYTSLVSGQEASVAQTGELTYEDPVELFAVDDVYIRSEADNDAEILGVISRGDAIEVLGETATHYQVKKDDVVGYAVRRCISEDEQEAIAAVEAEAAAQAAIRAAAEAAAAAPAGGSGVTEVRRQKFDDCDGSGHGYYEITYSDGSTGIEEY